MAGYIKRTPLSIFREQKRGGKGRAGMATKDEDRVTELFVTLDPQSGAVLLQPRRVYRMKSGACPKAGRTHKAGRWSNLLTAGRG